jgi:hypothetical protein
VCPSPGGVATDFNGVSGVAADRVRPGQSDSGWSIRLLRRELKDNERCGPLPDQELLPRWRVRQDEFARFTACGTPFIGRPLLASTSGE